MGKKLRGNVGVVHDFTVTAEAQSQLKKILSKKPEHSQGILRFRISVAGGGCAGFQYVFKVDDTHVTDDHIFGEEMAEVIIDDISLGLLKGSILDYEEELIGAQFVIKSNPQAMSSCGCKTSFSMI